jgi:hypothetical protein
MDTFEELCVKLVANADMMEVIELLHLTTEDLVERFEDRIEENLEEIREYMDEPHIGQ